MAVKDKTVNYVRISQENGEANEEKPEGVEAKEENETSSDATTTAAAPTNDGFGMKKVCKLALKISTVPLYRGKVSKNILSLCTRRIHRWQCLHGPSQILPVNPFKYFHSQRRGGDRRSSKLDC